MRDGGPAGVPRCARLCSPLRPFFGLSPLSVTAFGLLPASSPLRFASHIHGSQITSPSGGGKCKCVLRPKVGGKAKFFRASPYHSPDLVPRANTWLPPRGHEQRPRPADETGSCEWRSALVFASACHARRKNQLSARGAVERSEAERGAREANCTGEGSKKPPQAARKKAQDG